jgi:iron-sulfur cluster assembly protein
MFSIPGKAAVTLTPAAATRIRRLMETDGSMGLRVGVKKGGCAGMEYTMEQAQEIAAHEAVVEQDGARVLITPMAQMFLIGTEIDYQTTLLESGFKFRNPNVVDSCGCGESISFGNPAPSDA